MPLRKRIIQRIHAYLERQCVKHFRDANRARRNGQEWKAPLSFRLASYLEFKLRNVN